MRAPPERITFPSQATANQYKSWDSDSVMVGNCKGGIQANVDEYPTLPGGTLSHMLGTVSIKASPVPASIWMLGSALLGAGLRAVANAVERAWALTRLSELRT